MGNSRMELHGERGFTVLLVLLLAGLLSCSGGGSSSTPEASPETSQAPSDISGATSGSFPLKFHVEGNKIVSSEGNETVFRGVNIMDPVMLYYSANDPAYYWDRYLPWGEEIFQKMSEWGVKIVRMPIHPASWSLHGPEKCKAVIDQAIEWAGKYGIYVILDYHSVGFIETGDFEPDGLDETDPYQPLYDTTKEQMKSFWAYISNAYKDNDVVAFYDIFNEPVFPDYRTAPDYSPSAQTWDTWAGFAEEVIAIIRANDPDSIVLVGGLSYSYDLQFVTGRPIGYSNIVYTAHPYPGSSAGSGVEWQEAYLNLKKTYPVFATEIGYQLTKQDPYYLYSYTNYKSEIKSKLEENKISWTSWLFSPAANPELLADKNYTPTDAGSFIKSWLLEKN